MFNLTPVTAVAGTAYAAASAWVEQYLVWIKAAIGLALLIGLAVLAWRVSAWHSAYERVDAMEAELAATKAEIEQARASIVVSAETYATEINRGRMVAEENRRHANAQEAALKASLAQSDARGRDLARRLWDAAAQVSACRSTASGPASTAADPAGASGEPFDSEGVGGRLASHLAACERDATRLDGWREWWSGVRERWVAAGYPIEDPPP